MTPAAHVVDAVKVYGSGEAEVRAPAQLAVVLLVGLGAGVLAGWRAARLDVLRAIAAE